MGKIATHGEICTKLGLTQPPFANMCATRDSINQQYSHNWVGPTNYPLNRLVELSMVEKYTPPSKTVSFQCNWTGNSLTFLSVKGELTLSNGTKVPFLGSESAPVGFNFWSMNFSVNNVPAYDITNVSVTQVRYAINNGTEWSGGLRDYIIYNASNTVVLDLLIA